MRLTPTIRHLMILALAIFGGVGCAAFSNPTTWPSVPVRRLPDEVFGQSREAQLDIPQPLLRQPPPKEHIIDVGDTLGVILENVLGERNQIPPVQFPPVGSPIQTIGIGYPLPVLEDGTVVLPLIDPVLVKGLTIKEAQEKIRQTYIKGGQLLPDQIKLIVTLFRPRQYHVLVVRQDSGGVQLNLAQFIGTKRGSGFVLDLPAYENDLLTALARSGGLPGNDAKNEAIIQRGALKGDLKVFENGPIPGIETIRVPLRLRPGEPVPFKPDDLILQNGDIVFVQSRDAETYYTGGLLPPGEYPLPRDTDLDALQAVMQVRGPLLNGGVLNNNLTGSLISQGLGSPSPSQLTIIRKCPGKRQILIRVDLNRATQDARERVLIQPGDILVLQETLGESLTRYLTASIRSTFTGFYLRTPDAIGQANIFSP